MAIVITNPSPLVQNTEGTLDYINPLIIPTINHIYVLKDSIGTVVSNNYSTEINSNEFNFTDVIIYTSGYVRLYIYDDTDNIYC